MQHFAGMDQTITDHHTNWAFKRPVDWTRKDVLDWIYCVVEEEQFDGSKFQGEVYRGLIGMDLCMMTGQHFHKVDPVYGFKIYESFLDVCSRAYHQKDQSGVQTIHSSTVTREHFGIDDNNNSIQLEMTHLSGIPQGDAGFKVTQTDSDIIVDIANLGAYPISQEIELTSKYSPCPSPSFSSFFRPLTEFYPTTSTHNSSPHPVQKDPLVYPEIFTKAPGCSQIFRSSPAFRIQPSSGGNFCPSSEGNFCPSSGDNYCPSSVGNLCQSSGGNFCPSSGGNFCPSSGDNYCPLSVGNLCQSSSTSVDSVGQQHISEGSPSSLSDLSLPECLVDQGYSSEDSMSGPSFMPPLGDSPPKNTFVSDMAHLGINYIPKFESLDSPKIDKKVRNEFKKHKCIPAKSGILLWKFVRDLLQDPTANPRLLKWEDRDHGVFRFVQSEKVAKLWGAKKNNPVMTYEKFSRAMRFCRKAGYFDSVPKTGRFPKKLCFMFGGKAKGWKEW